MAGRGGRAGVVVLSLAACGGHLLYPAWLFLASRRRRVVPPPAPASWPPLTVLVPAYREAGLIAEKIDDVRSNGYGGELEVLVVADGDAETAAAARAAGAQVLEPPERLGKAQALNLGVASASHGLIVVTDANTRLSPHALAALVRWFEVPNVGAVAGEKRELGEAAEGAYWRFESWLKQREAALGTTIGLVGELAALSKAAWEPIPTGVGIDDLWIALDMAERGYVVAHEPDAVAYEPPAESFRARWERRTRNVAGAFNVFARKRRQLGPEGGLLAVQVWGHRLWRYTGGPLAHLWLLALAVRRAGRSRVAQVTVAAHAVAIAVVVPRSSGRTVPRLLRIPADVVFLHAVALGGLVRYSRGDRGIVWSTPAR